MKFENALVAMRKGLKVQRESSKGRLNGVCLFMKKGVIYAKQTHEMSSHAVKELSAINSSQLLADDWTTKGVL